MHYSSLGELPGYILRLADRFGWGEGMEREWNGNSVQSFPQKRFQILNISEIIRNLPAGAALLKFLLF